MYVMHEIPITEARAQLSSLVDAARDEPVYLTRRNLAVAAIVDSRELDRLLEDAEELADIRAVDEAWAETAELDDLPIPWDDVKRDLGLA